jgi:uncharacterized protein YwqG
MRIARNLNLTQLGHNAMFSDQKHALNHLNEHFDQEQAAIIVRLLRPYLRLVAAPEVSRPGQTRIGGTPDLSPESHSAGSQWPIREVPKDVDAIVNLGGSNHEAHLRKHLAQPLPYSFIAQIDLEEAARLTETHPTLNSGLLPDHGRLLFFCDVPTVPWRNGIESCHVRWDVSARDTLTRATTPAILQELAKASIAELIAEFKKYKMKPETLSDPYSGVERALRLEVGYALPDARAPESADDREFSALMADEDISDTYSDFISEIGHDRAQGLERHRVLGYPLPEQDDPRYDAVALVDYAQERSWEWTDRPEMAVIEAQMKQWHLLLQCDLSDYHQDPLCEGTLYFLIREDDLRSRNFDRVVVVYQQT